MLAENPFAPPLAPAATLRPAPSMVRVGAALALLAEIVLPLAREGAVWLALVTVDGTRWLGIAMVVLQATAASLLVWRTRPAGRLFVAVIGLAVIAVVASASTGHLQARFVDPASRMALGAVELSQGGAAAVALGNLGRSRWAGLAAIGVAANAIGSVLMVFDVGGLRPLVLAIWIGGRLVRYASLTRLAAG